MTLGTLNAASDPHSIEVVVVADTSLAASSLRKAAGLLGDVMSHALSGIDFGLFIDGSKPNLGLTASPPTITASDAQSSGPLNTYIQDLQLPGPRPATIESRWGRASSGLVVALTASTGAAAELYDVDGTIAGVPLVAVSFPTGTTPAVPLWANVAVRAVAQLRFGLIDEYELSGSQWLAPADSAAGCWRNVILVTGSQRAQLVAGTSPATVLGEALSSWPVRARDTLTFVPHPGATGTPSIEAPTGPQLTATGISQLVEGAAGFRTGALRSAADCLMHRIPSNAILPIQDEVGFCPACRALIDRSVQDGEGRGLEPRVYLNNQRTQYDRDGKFTTPVQFNASDVQPTTLSSGIAPSDFSWTATADTTSGFVFSNLMATNRPLDPFTSSNDVLKSVAFENISVAFADGTPAVALDIASCIQSGKAKFENYIGGPGDTTAIGMKLTCSWADPTGWTFEGLFTLVLKQPACTIDPGAAIHGLKIYPQAALRAVRTPGHDGSLPPIDHFYLDTVLVANNALAQADMPTMMALSPPGGSMAGGSMSGLIANLFTDTNGGGADAKYTGNSVSNALLLAALANDSTLGTLADLDVWLLLAGTGVISPLEYQSGRRVAGVQSFATQPPLASIPAAGAWLFHRASLGPPLGHWSWLFDYCIPDCLHAAGSPPTAIPVVWGEWEQVGSASARTARSTSINYPSKSQFADLAPSQTNPAITVSKLPRQGAYDNVHITPPMGFDSQNPQQKVIAAPFCGDLCLHLHFRWGVDGVDNLAVSNKQRFKGWSLGAGARSGELLGTPLSPPNQHVQISLKDISPDTLHPEIQLTYSTTIQFAYPGTSPVSAAARPGNWQVTLEQGLGFAFSYQGLPLPALMLAAIATLGGLPNGVHVTSLGNDPAGAMNRRKVFFAMYERQRFFDQVHDNAAHFGQLPQQVPDLSTLSTTRTTIEGL